MQHSSAKAAEGYGKHGKPPQPPAACQHLSTLTCHLFYPLAWSLRHLEARFLFAMTATLLESAVTVQAQKPKLTIGQPACDYECARQSPSIFKRDSRDWASLEVTFISTTFGPRAAGETLYQKKRRAFVYILQNPRGSTGLASKGWPEPSKRDAGLLWSSLQETVLRLCACLVQCGTYDCLVESSTKHFYRHSRLHSSQALPFTPATVATEWLSGLEDFGDSLCSLRGCADCAGCAGVKRSAAFRIWTARLARCRNGQREIRYGGLWHELEPNVGPQIYYGVGRGRVRQKPWALRVLKKHLCPTLKSRQLCAACAVAACVGIGGR